MAFRGRKIADIYAALHLDRDDARSALRNLGGELGRDADRAGQDLGRKLSEGLARSVEASSARVAKARRAEVDAAKAVELAELRLNEARKKGVGEGTSRMLSLTNQLEKAHYRLSQAQSNTVTSTKKLEDAQRRLSLAMADVGKSAGPAADKAGGDLGERIFAGLHVQMIRRSPLVAAAIAGGLLAGAPLVLTAATGLFAGVGIVSAAQSEKVQSAWLGTWQQVRDGAIADAAVIEPVLVRLADRVGDGFERNRPRLRGMFEDTAPQIEVFADGLMGLVDNVLPGFERAIARGMPVTRGFADFLEATGTGLTGFLDNISEHAPAAGEAFALLGDIFGQLLPLTGELLGQGAELATIVLPALSGTLGALVNVTEAVGPALPVITAGLLGWKVADLVGTGLGKLGDKLTVLSDRGGRFAGTAGKVGGALSSLNSVAGTAGLTGVLVGLDSFFSKVEEASSKWAAALREGGAAAEAARLQMADFGTAQAAVTSGFDGAVLSILGFGTTSAATALSIDQVNDKLREQFQAMDPLAQAQAKVAEWSSTLRDRMADESTSAGDLEAAKRRLAHWQDEAARLSQREEMAIRGVTAAMVDNINQSRARVDSAFAFELALEGVEDALARQKELMQAGTATADELSDAARDVAMAYRDVGGAASDQAMDALPASLNDAQRAAMGAKAELQYYRDLVATGVDLPPSLDQHMAYLSNVVAGADLATVEAAILKAQAEETGGALDVLGGKIATPTIDADDTGFSSIWGLAMNKVAELDGQTPTPRAQMDPGPFNQVWGNVMGLTGTLGGQRPTPVAQLDSGPFSNVMNWIFGQTNAIGAQRPTPIATMIANTANAEYWLNQAARNRTSYVTQMVNTQVAFRQAGGAAGGKIASITRGFADGGTPRRRSDGKLIGAGGPLDDLIPAVTDTGERIRVANTEWLVRGFIAQQQGDRRMAALNSGRADIVMREPARRFADGGRPAISDRQAATAQGITIHGGLTVKIEGSFALANGMELRRMGQKIRDVLVNLERERA